MEIIRSVRSSKTSVQIEKNSFFWTLKNRGPVYRLLDSYTYLGRFSYSILRKYIFISTSYTMYLASPSLQNARDLSNFLNDTGKTE